MTSDTRTPETEAARTLLGMVDSLDSPDPTRGSLFVSMEFLRLSIAAIEAEARTAALREAREAVAGLPVHVRDALAAPRTVDRAAVLRLLGGEE